MAWDIMTYTIVSCLCFAFRIEADIIFSNGTHIMRKTNDSLEYKVIRKNSDSTSKSIWIPCLAVDWSEEQLFWFEKTDTSKAIHASNIEGTPQKIIINTDIGDVTSIAVDDRNKILYWSDATKETIERADYDGKNGRIIHGVDRHRIVVLAVDTIHATLYWSDDDGLRSDEHSLNSSKTDGSDRKLAYKFNIPKQKFLQLDIITQENDSNLLLYWLGGGSIFSLSNCSVRFDCSIQNLRIEITDALRSKSVSFASKPNSQHYQREDICKDIGCSHVCMPMNGTSARCSCPSFGGLVLVSERNCSTVSEPFLIYSDDSTGYIGIIDLYPRYSTSDQFLIARRKKPRGIAYDKIEKMVYFFEEMNQTIFKINIDGTGLEEVLSLQKDKITTIKALAVDPVQRRLYFTLSKVGSMTRIEALDLELYHRRTVTVGEDIHPNILYILRDRLHFVRNWICMLSDMDGFNSSQGFCSTNVSIDKLIAMDSPLSFMVDEHNNSEILICQRGTNTEIWHGQNKTTSALKLQGFGSYALATTQIHRNSAGRICDKGSEKNKCTGLCFRTLNETIARCHCPTYQFNVLQEDARNCSPPEEFVLFSEGTEIRMMGRGRTPDASIYTIAESANGDIESFAFQRPYVYFITHNESRTLYRKSMERSQTEAVVNFSTPARLMKLNGNRIYWLSNDEDIWTVRSVSLDGNETSIHFKRNLTIVSDYAFDAIGNMFIVSRQGVTLLRQNETDDILFNTSKQWNPVVAVMDDENRVLYVATTNNTIEYMNTIPERISSCNKESSVWKRIDINAPSPNEDKITSMSLSSGRLYLILKSLNGTNASLMSINLMLTSIGRREEINAKDPRGLFIFTKKTHDLFEPSTVITPGTCPNTLQEKLSCLVYECITDYGCGGNGRICCPVSKKMGTICASPLSPHRYIDATCKNCTNGDCKDLTCPPIGNCSIISKLNCCPICLDITYCSEKPIIEDCPDGVFNFTLPSNNDSVTIDVNMPPFNVIRAHDCSLGRRRIRVELRKKILTWQREAQLVDVTAEDTNGESVCKVSAKVRDVTAPWFQSCPSDMEFYSKDLVTTATWFDPVAYDNVAKPPILQQEDKHYQSPMDVSVGTVYSFKYTAKDFEDNIGQPCSFTISALQIVTPCSSPPQIQQGSLFCQGDPDSMQCHIKECAKGFVLMAEFNQTYRCQNGNWVPPFNDNIQTRACLRTRFLSLDLQLNVDLLNSEMPTKNDVIKCFQKLFLCPEPRTDGYYILCTENNIQLTRQENVLQLELKIMHQLRFNETVEGVKSEMNNTLTGIYLGLINRLISTYCLILTGQVQNMSRKEDIYCEPGSILLPSKINCSLCPPGEYEAGSSCRQCLKGYYNNRPGQTECVKCDDDKTTQGLGSYSKTHCVSVATTSSESINIIVIVGIVCGTLLLFAVIVAVTIYKLKTLKKSEYPTGSYMDETYLRLASRTNEDPYDNRKSIYDEIPADTRM